MSNQHPTDQVCPKNKSGGRHHLIPRNIKGKQIMACITCNKTEAEIRNGS